MTSHILSKLYWPLTPAPSSRVQDEPWAWALARDLHPLVWWILLGVALGFAASSYFYHRRVLVLRSLGRKQSGLLLAHAGVLKGAPVFYHKNIYVIAHRGLARYATENTSPAILLAATAGANGVEVDIRFTKDRVPVLFHDSKVIQSGRTLVPLRKLTCEELKTIKMHPANQIPTLDDFLGYAKRFSLIMLDLKDVRKGRASYEDLNGISECLKMHGVIEKVIVHLADPEWVKQASELGMIASLRLQSEPPAALLARGIRHITLTIAAGRAYYERYGWSDLRVCGVCPKSVEDVWWFFDRGAYAVITDFVEESLDLLEEKGYVSRPT